MLLPLTAGFLFGLLLGSFIPYLPLSIVIILLATAGVLTYLEQRGTLSRRHGFLVYGSVVVGLLYWSLDASLIHPGLFSSVAKKVRGPFERPFCTRARPAATRAVVGLCLAKPNPPAEESQSQGRGLLPWREPNQHLKKNRLPSTHPP